MSLKALFNPWWRMLLWPVLMPVAVILVLGWVLSELFLYRVFDIIRETIGDDL